MREIRARFAIALIIAVSLVTAACASSETASPGTPALAEGWQRVDGLRGDRYCEVLLVKIVEGRVNADVWNTIGLNDCPEEQWSALDGGAIASERGALTALLNGPRYWLMDGIEARSGERERTSFGPLEMMHVATVDLGPVPPNTAPYTERHVARDTVFVFEGNRDVFELVDAGGRAYVMQSYSAQTTGLSESELPDLGDSLGLPEGWSYRVRHIDGALRVRSANGEAAVVQDELGDTYQLFEE